MAALQRMVSVDRTGLEQLATSISSHHMDADVNTLLHIHDTSQQFESKTNGDTIRLLAASTVLILFILYYFAQAYLWNVVKSCAVKRENTGSEGVQKSQCNMPPPLCNLMSVV
jgi:predicted transcriptional regulator